MNNTHRILILISMALVTAGGLRAQSTGSWTTPSTTTGSTETGATASGGASVNPKSNAGGNTANKGKANPQPVTTTTDGTTAGTTGEGNVAKTPPGQVAKTPSGEDAKTPPGQDKRHTVNENASDNAKAVQALLKTFDARRDQLMAERKALLGKLDAAATEAEKKEILEELRTENQARHEEQRALRREIGAELKNLREQRKGSGGS
jgi:hypothetical protein